MSKVYCNSCGNFFDADEVEQFVDDSTGAWEEYCPECHSTDIEVARECELCGNGALDQFCEGCKADFRLALDNAVAQVARWHKVSSPYFDKVERLLLDYIESEVM
jgi:hypothetical protein